MPQLLELLQGLQLYRAAQVILDCEYLPCLWRRPGAPLPAPGPGSSVPPLILLSSSVT